MTDDALETKLAAIIAEQIEIGYTIRPDGLVDPATIRVTSAAGAAHMAVHFMTAGQPEK